MRFHSRRGVTLIEISIVVAIVGVLAVIGVGMMRDTVPSWRTRRAAMEFAQNVNQARLSAVAVSTEYRIVLEKYDNDLDDPNGQNSAGAYLVQKGDAMSSSTIWDTLPVDMDGSDAANWQGNIDFSEGAENQLVGVSLQDWGSISGPSGEGNVLVFSPRGWMTNPASDFACDANGDGSEDGYVCLTFVNKKARARGRTDEWKVIISRGGIARVVPTDGAISTGSSGTGTNTTPGDAPSGYTGGSEGSST